MIYRQMLPSKIKDGRTDVGDQTISELTIHNISRNNHTKKLMSFQATTLDDIF